MTAPDLPRIVVTAAVIERDDRFLVTRRLRGTHLEGYWEFPGGKCDPGESLEACLRRELLEELGCDSRLGPEVYHVTHSYPERSVELHFFQCELIGEPQALLGQAMQWVPRSELATLEFPPADVELISKLVGIGLLRNERQSRHDR